MFYINIFLTLILPTFMSLVFFILLYGILAVIFIVARYIIKFKKLEENKLIDCIKEKLITR